jgi:hypothetical protein
MKRLLQMAELQLKRSRGTSTLAIMTWILGANVAGAIGQHLNQIIVGAISDSIESQVLLSVSLLAGMNGSGFDCDSIAIQVAVALSSGALLAIFPSLVSKMCLAPKSERTSTYRRSSSIHL